MAGPLSAQQTCSPGEPSAPRALSQARGHVSGLDLSHMMEQGPFTELLLEGSQKPVPLTLPRKAGNRLLQRIPVSGLSAACLCVPLNPAALPSGSSTSPCPTGPHGPHRGLERATSCPRPRKASAALLSRHARRSKGHGPWKMRNSSKRLTVLSEAAVRRRLVRSRLAGLEVGAQGKTPRCCLRDVTRSPRHMWGRGPGPRSGPCKRSPVASPGRGTRGFRWKKRAGTRPPCGSATRSAPPAWLTSTPIRGCQFARRVGSVIRPLAAGAAAV